MVIDNNSLTYFFVLGGLVRSYFIWYFLFLGENYIELVYCYFILLNYKNGSGLYL